MKKTILENVPSVVKNELVKYKKEKQQESTNEFKWKKKLLGFISVLCFFLAFTACNNSSNNSNVFDSKKLVGKYKMDFNKISSEITKSEEKEDDWSKAAKGIAMLAFNTVNFEINFYEGNTGTLILEGGLVNAFEDIDNIQDFVYKIENDSVLFMKEKTEKEFNKWAYIKRINENYDYIQLTLIDMENRVLTLKKIKE